VVGKFVEFYGPGLSDLPLADRATIANMAPEYGATCGIFPVDGETLNYLRTTGRPEQQIKLVEAYMLEQGMFFNPAAEASYSDTLELDLATVVPSLAGPSRPQDRVPLTDMKASFTAALPKAEGRSEGGDREGEGLPLALAASGPEPTTDGTLTDGSVGDRRHHQLHQHQQPYVMVAAGLVAKKAGEKGLQTKPW